MSKSSTRRKRRAVLSARMGVKWDGRGKLNRLETIDQFTDRIWHNAFRKMTSERNLHEC